MKRTLSMLLCVLMLLTLLSACGQSGATTAPSSTGTGTSTATAPQSTTKPVQPSGWTEAQATKSFVYHVSAANPSLHKWATTSNNTLRVLSYLFFDPIISKDEKGNYIPWLAKSWDFASDYKSVTFHLRDDVYFTDGGQMTADDLIFTFELMRDDTKHMPDSVVKGWRTYIGELKKVDQFSFTLNFKVPMPEFWNMITDSSLQVISKAAYEKMGYDAYWMNPVGTGPYVVKAWDKANSICKLTLRTDAHGWWAYDANKTYTNVKDITVQYSPEATTRLASLRSGEVHMIDTIPTADKVNLDKEGFTTQVMPPVNSVFLQAACAKGDILENQKLREALSLSINRKLIVDSLLSGYAIPIKWPARSGDLGYEDKEAIVYDKDKAKKLVSESGYKGEEIDFIYTTSTVNIGNELTQAIQSMAAEVGIKLKIRPLEVAVYNDARTKHDYDLCLAAIGDSGNMWYKIGAEVIGNDRFNTGFQNTKLKELGKSLATVMDTKEADRIYKEIFTIETTEFAPNLYLYWPTIINVWNKSVTGVQLHNNQFPDLTTLIIN